MISPRRLVNTLGGLLVSRRVFFTPVFMVTKSCTKILILPKIFPTAKSCTKSSQDFQMAGNMLSWQNLSPRFSNGGCHENLDSARKSVAPLLSLGDKQRTLETQNGHGHYDAAIAEAAAAVTHVQSLSQEVGSGDEGLGLFGFDLSSAETDFWWLGEEQSRRNRNQHTRFVGNSAVHTYFGRAPLLVGETVERSGITVCNKHRV